MAEEKEKKNMKVAIATLTCNDRADLNITIETFLRETDNRSFIWHVLLQGCTEEFITNIREKFIDSGLSEDNFILHVEEVNLGLSKGMNKLMENIQNHADFEFILNLEDDWFCMPKACTKMGKDWLDVCLAFLDSDDEISTLFLRHYVNEQEKAKYAWSRSIHYVCFHTLNNFNYREKMRETYKFDFQGIEFQKIPKFLYSANPTLFRLADYLRVGIFPLHEYADVHQVKENWETSSTQAPFWGQAEGLAMEKHLSLICYNVGRGKFAHSTG